MFCFLDLCSCMFPIWLGTFNQSHSHYFYSYGFLHSLYQSILTVNRWMKILSFSHSHVNGEAREVSQHMIFGPSQQTSVATFSLTAA